MNPNDLPERWVRRLEEYTDEKYGPAYKHRGKLSASDFPTSALVHVGFPDGSYALFRYAFFLVEDWKEAGIFTEHSGYHIFPLIDLQIESFEAKWDSAEAESDDGA